MAKKKQQYKAVVHSDTALTQHVWSNIAGLSSTFSLPETHAAGGRTAGKKSWPDGGTKSQRRRREMMVTTTTTRACWRPRVKNGGEKAANRRAETLLVVGAYLAEK